MRVCASSVSPTFGGPAETKKARHRRCFKPPICLPGDHRHVRIWASRHLCASRVMRKRNSRKSLLFRTDGYGAFTVSTGRAMLRAPKGKSARAEAEKRRGGSGRPSDRPPIGSSRRWFNPARLEWRRVGHSSTSQPHGSRCIILFQKCFRRRLLLDGNTASRRPQKTEVKPGGALWFRRCKWRRCDCGRRSSSKDQGTNETATNQRTGRYSAPVPCRM